MSRPPVIGPQIIEKLQEHHLLTAPGLLEVLSASGISCNKTTVYRSLDKLLDEGKVCRLNFGTNNEVYYELSDHHHDHVVCTVCQKVESTSCSHGSVPEIIGFTIEHHHCVLFGVCDGCSGL